MNIVIGGVFRSQGGTPRWYCRGRYNRHRAGRAGVGWLAASDVLHLSAFPTVPLAICHLHFYLYGNNNPPAGATSIPDCVWTQACKLYRWARIRCEIIVSAALCFVLYRWTCWMFVSLFRWLLLFQGLLRCSPEDLPNLIEIGLAVWAERQTSQDHFRDSWISPSSQNWVILTYCIGSFGPRTPKRRCWISKIFGGNIPLWALWVVRTPLRPPPITFMSPAAVRQPEWRCLQQSDAFPPRSRPFHSRKLVLSVVGVLHRVSRCRPLPLLLISVTEG